jgi:sugar/nucleoside kinase (ribokinase family)
VLCVIGDLVEDVVVHPDGVPAAGTDTPSTVRRTRGGSAANVAAAAVVAGCPTRFVGRVGDDATGAALVAGLTAAGVDARVQRAGRTGCVVIIVAPDGERTMLPDRGAAADLGPVDPAWLNGVRWLHVPAYSLVAEPIASSTVAAVQQARAAGAGLSLDVSSVGTVTAFGRDRFVARARELRPDVVLATGEEAALLDPWRPTLLVVKHGADPVVLRPADGPGTSVPVPPLDGVVDTTGAGDAFAGGYLAATLAGAPPADAVAAGTALAQRTLRTPGAAIAP